MRLNNVGALIVLSHLVVVIGHGSAHDHLRIGTTAWQRLFIATVIVAAPLISVALLWKRPGRLGAVLLFLSMSGSLIFGVVYHFLLPGADNAFEMTGHHGTLLFVTTAWLLAAVEALACVWSLRALKGI